MKKTVPIYTANIEYDIVSNDSGRQRILSSGSLNRQVIKGHNLNLIKKRIERKVNDLVLTTATAKKNKAVVVTNINLVSSHGYGVND